MIRAGKPLQWIAHQLGHVGVKKIDEIYGRWTRSPAEEPLDLDILTSNHATNKSGTAAAEFAKPQPNRGCGDR
jgi:hypothetical protein